MASIARATSRDHSLTASLSSSGTPRSSEITATGNGYASSSITSIRGASAARSSSRSTMSWTRPRSVSTTRGVKALLTSARSRVWSGGSRNSMDSASQDPSGPPPKRLSNSAW